jgi:hypothetical protein
VPLQALYLLNNGFVRGRAAALAARVQAQASEGHSRQVEAAFRLALGRSPDAIERQAAVRFFTRHDEVEALVAFCQALLSINEFVYLE